MKRRVRACAPAVVDFAELLEHAIDRLAEMGCREVEQVIPKRAPRLPVHVRGQGDDLLTADEIGRQRQDAQLEKHRQALKFVGLEPSDAVVGRVLGWPIDLID